MYIYHIFFIHSSVDGPLACFHVLAIVNNSAVNTNMHIYFLIAILFYWNKWPIVLNHMVVIFLVFWGTSLLFSIEVAPVCIPTNNSAWGTSVPFFPASSSTLGFHGLLIIAILTGVRGILLWFWFAFSWWLVMLSIFSCVCWPSVCLFLEKCLLRSSAHFLIVF